MCDPATDPAEHLTSGEIVAGPTADTWSDLRKMQAARSQADATATNDFHKTEAQFLTVAATAGLSAVLAYVNAHPSSSQAAGALALICFGLAVIAGAVAFHLRGESINHAHLMWQDQAIFNLDFFEVETEEWKATARGLDCKRGKDIVDHKVKGNVARARAKTALWLGLTAISFGVLTLSYMVFTNPNQVLGRLDSDANRSLFQAAPLETPAMPPAPDTANVVDGEISEARSPVLLDSGDSKSSALRGVVRK